MPEDSLQNESTTATGTLNVIFIAAHPDECEMYGGGLAAHYARLGHRVKFVSLTCGDAGHRILDREPLAARRYDEGLAAAKHLGVIAYDIFETHDGDLIADLALRHRVMRVIGDWKADVVVSLHPDGFGHPDNRAAGQATADAMAFVGNRNAMLGAGTTPLSRAPIYLWMIDYITTRVHRHDIGIDCGPIMEEKLLACDAHATQFYEANPHGIELSAGADSPWEERKAYLLKYWDDCLYAQPYQRDALTASYGEEAGNAVVYAETFQFALDGRRPDASNAARLFPMLSEEGVQHLIRA